MMRGYYRMITEIDDEIGALRNLLAKKGRLKIPFLSSWVIMDILRGQAIGGQMVNVRSFHPRSTYHF